MKILLSLIVFSLVVTGAQAQQDSTAGAQSIAQRVEATLGGDAWAKARYIAFDFTPERDGKIVSSIPQRYDRFTGDYRVEGKNRDGVPYLVIMNVNTKKGRAWLDGKEVEQSAELLEMGYRRFINDTYWLLMPLKLRDPGVTLASEGERTDCGRVYDIVKLSFGDGVGITSKDQYWIHVDRATNMIDLWEMKLQGSKPEDPRRAYRFLRLERRGGVLLPTRKEAVDGKSAILLENLVISENVPKGAFDAP
jgi:hypothetical protein